MNYDMMHTVSQCINTIVINSVIMLLFNAIYMPRYDKKILYVASTLLWVSMCLFVNSFNNPPLNMLFYIASTEGICILLYNTNLKKSWVYNIIMLFLFLANDTITYVIWSLMFGIGFGEISDDFRLLILSNIINIFFSFMEYKIAVSIIDKSELKEIKKQETFFIFFMTIIECYIIYSLIIGIDDFGDGLITVASVWAFTVFNVYITYTFNKLAELYKYKYDADLLRRQNTIQLEHYKEMEITYQRTRLIIHDIKKHIDVMNDLKVSDYNSYLEYNNTLEKRLDSLFGNYKMSNSILGIIISRKIAVAEGKGITVSTDVEDITLSFMDELDITGIFSNLWDNAIEACDDLSEGKGSILFEMKIVDSFLIVNMSNSYDRKKYRGLKEKGLKSTKKSHMGIGLSAIETLVDKYNGFFNIDPQNDRFVIEITIPITT